MEALIYKVVIMWEDDSDKMASVGSATNMTWMMKMAQSQRNFAQVEYSFRLNILRKNKRADNENSSDIEAW